MSEETKAIEKKCGHNCLLCGYEWLGRCIPKNKFVTEVHPICDEYWYAGTEERLEEIDSCIDKYDLTNNVYALCLSKDYILTYEVKGDTYTISFRASRGLDPHLKIKYVILREGDVKASGNISPAEGALHPVTIHCESIRFTVVPMRSRDHKKILSVKVYCTDIYKDEE